MCASQFCHLNIFLSFAYLFKNFPAVPLVLCSFHTVAISYIMYMHVLVVGSIPVHAVRASVQIQRAEENCKRTIM